MLKNTLRSHKFTKTKNSLKLSIVVVYMIVDAHVHCYELEDLEKYINQLGINMVCVSDDPRSSELTVEIASKYSNIVPCVGTHPWLVHEYKPVEAFSPIEKLIEERNIYCLGEVGLDKRFRPLTFDKQLEVFKEFVRLAREYDLVLNLHAAGAWREVYEFINKSDIDKAYFHWYTGPLDLLREIESSGYFIGVNPAWQVQQSHRLVIKFAKINNILTESDAPYNYRNIAMTPDLIEKTIVYISEVKKVQVNAVVEQIYANYKKLFKNY